ncbi:MAG: C10 family peptidase [Bacteroides sp.]|nr:C10 family peptidase [Bacteroides sp.]MCM1378640.1 C10 family peptidase [Bacteroides sp.]MCM1446386.1 C10 family peptidase [Prevotella sp.]
MKRTLIYLTTLLVAASLSAEILSPAQALARVQGGGSVRKLAGRVAAEAVPARVVALDAEPEIYVFTPAAGGLMLVSAESETPALIGYTDNYAPGSELPPALEAMMKNWAAEIAAQRAGKVVYGAESRAADDLAAIEPICKTHWDQDSPYNGKCPVLGGRRTYTGCVATAMAQVLKVHRYPAKCSGGTYSYKWQSGGKNLSLNFDDVVLDWDNMLDTYTSTATQTQKDAVATLMQAVGYAADMEYMAEASGASGFMMFRGLARNFGVDVSTLEYAQREWFTLAEWQKKIYDTLAEGYPVYYDGQTADEQPVGHAFVVDGYRSNGYFHLNWGWGGMSDGYFLLTALDPDAQGIGGAYPSAGFDAGQSAIFGIKPGSSTAVAPPRFANYGGFAAANSTASVGEYATFTFIGSTYNMGLTSIDFVPAIIITDATGKEFFSSYSSSVGNFNVTSGFGGFDFPVVIPFGLPAGTYTIKPAVYFGGKYYPIYCTVGTASTVTATVKGSNVTFDNGSAAKLEAESISVPETVYTNKPFVLSGEIAAVTTSSYYGSVTVNMYRPEKPAVCAKLGSFLLSVDGGSSTTFHASCVLENEIFTSGTYEVGFVDMFGQEIGGREEFELVSTRDTGELRASGLKCLDSWKENLEFSVDVTASGGSFKGTLYIMLMTQGNYDYSKYELLLESEPIEVDNNKTATVKIAGAFPNGEVGKKYTAYVYYDNSGSWVEMSGRQRTNFTLSAESGIEKIVADGDADGIYYDLAGRRVAHPTRGLYLRNGNKILL